MQNGLRTALVCVILGFSAFSCRDLKNVDSVSQIENSKVDVIDFRGEKVKVHADFPKALFEQSPEDFDRYYESVANNSKSRVGTGGIHITYEELLPILVKHLSKFPRINSEDEISEKDLIRIFEDFPEIRTRQQADEKRIIIFDFYQTLAKRDIVKDVIAFENVNQENERTTDVSPDNLTIPEKNHLLLNPGYAQWYVQAAKDSYAFVMTVYGVNSEDTKSNAFKHATWNALSIRYILKGSPASENQAIDFTQDGTSKHEQDANGNQIHSDQAAMDLHNNMSARVWMESETKWGFGPFRKMPDSNDIVTTMVSKANSSPLLTRVAILNLHGGDNVIVWNNLFNNMYGPHQHLVHLLQ